MKIIKLLSSRSITQTIVSDCSFVSSLAISADFERRFKTKLITSCIFPQDSHGNPAVSPSGRYFVRLHINGVWRKVIIDDFLPTSASGELLCSFSNNKGELWVSLLEKAYLKVMVGTLSLSFTSVATYLFTLCRVAMTSPEATPVLICMPSLAGFLSACRLRLGTRPPGNACGKGCTRGKF